MSDPAYPSPAPSGSENAAQPSVPRATLANAPVVIWITLGVLNAAVFWILSCLRLLNGVTILLALGACAAGLAMAIRKSRVRLCWPSVRARRFRRLLPLLFAAVLLLTLAGGLVYAPNTFDTISYRIPRILNWLEEGGWHWIASPEKRMNTRLAGYEILATPLIALARTDRPLFLINWLSYLLLPGVVFQLLRALRVGRRAAWTGMWLLPSGYVYALQAGSVGNDAYAAVYGCAAFAYVLRASRSGCMTNFWVGVAAAALMSSAKLANLPLGLPLAVLSIPLLGTLVSKPLTSGVLLTVCLLASCVPQSVLNQVYTGEWSGLGLEIGGAPSANPLLVLLGNAILVAVQNLLPPFLPSVSAIQTVVHGWIPPAWLAEMQQFFEGRYQLGLGELTTVERAGLGMGVSWSLLGMLAFSPRKPLRLLFAGWDWRTGAVLGLSALGLLVILMKSFYAPVSRYLTCYYPLLVAAILLAVQLTRTRMWLAQLLVGFSYLSTLLVLIPNPGQPLVPASWLMAAAGRAGLSSASLDRVEAVYSVYADRAGALVPIRRAIPDGVDHVALLMASDVPETSLWKPFGTMRVQGAESVDHLESLRKRGYSVAVVDSSGFEDKYGMPLDAWLREDVSVIVSRQVVRTKVSAPPAEWLVVRLK